MIWDALAIKGYGRKGIKYLTPSVLDTEISCEVDTKMHTCSYLTLIHPSPYKIDDKKNGSIAIWFQICILKTSKRMIFAKANKVILYDNLKTRRK